MGDDYNQWAQSMVQKILYLTIASVSADGVPWNSPVYSSFDNDANFFWTSSPQARHSRNIADTGRVALVIYDSTVPEGTGTGAVYMEASADGNWLRDARAAVDIGALRGLANWA